MLKNGRIKHHLHYGHTGCTPVWSFFFFLGSAFGSAAMKLRPS